MFSLIWAHAYTQAIVWTHERNKRQVIVTQLIVPYMYTFIWCDKYWQYNTQTAKRTTLLHVTIRGWSCPKLTWYEWVDDCDRYRAPSQLLRERMIMILWNWLVVVGWSGRLKSTTINMTSLTKARCGADVLKSSTCKWHVTLMIFVCSFTPRARIFSNRRLAPPSSHFFSLSRWVTRVNHRFAETAVLCKRWAQSTKIIWK